MKAMQKNGYKGVLQNAVMSKAPATLGWGQEGHLVTDLRYLKGRSDADNPKLWKRFRSDGKASKVLAISNDPRINPASPASKARMIYALLEEHYHVVLCLDDNYIAPELLPLFNIEDPHFTIAIPLMDRIEVAGHPFPRKVGYWITLLDRYPQIRMASARVCLIFCMHEKYEQKKDLDMIFWKMSQFPNIGNIMLTIGSHYKGFEQFLPIQCRAPRQLQTNPDHMIDQAFFPIGRNEVTKPDFGMSGYGYSREDYNSLISDLMEVAGLYGLQDNLSLADSEDELREYNYLVKQSITRRGLFADSIADSIQTASDYEDVDHSDETF